MSRGVRLVIGALMLALGVCGCMPVDGFALGEGRVYELVSPLYKGGYGATEIEDVSNDGDGVVFDSQGSFLGNHGLANGANVYLARRGASEWSSVALVPPVQVAPISKLQDISPTLESVLFAGNPGPSYGSANYSGAVNEFLLHRTATSDTAENWEVAGIPFEGLESQRLSVAYEATSEDFSHILFYSFASEPILSQAKNTKSQLYDLVSSGGDGALTGVLELVGLDNKGAVINPFCGVFPGAESGKESKFNSVSSDGGEIFFTTSVEPGAGNACSNGVVDPKQLFVRLGGERTLEVSRPLEPTKQFGGCGDGGTLGEVPGEVPCSGAAARAGAEFDGASKDGSRVFFTTAAPLVSEDMDKANDLYMAEIGCPSGESVCEPASREVTSLVQVSHDPNGEEAANVQGTVLVSADGSHVYFVARGILSSGSEVGTLESEGRPVPHAGADNLYVYDASLKKIGFVADLCSDPESSGEWRDAVCPLDLTPSEEGINDTALWLEHYSEAQTTGDGGSLVFSSYGQLTADDTDTAKDVYRYDAETDRLNRVSIGEDGFDSNGNKSLDSNGNNIYARIPTLEHETRAISEDGTRVVFKSNDPLSEDAVNGLENAYEWHEEPGSGEGRVSLISTGSSDEAVESVAISAAGGDVFFVTSQGLVPQDTDGAADVYDARIGGGFPSPSAPRQPCSGDACQGPLSVPAPLLVPGSISQAPGENLAAPVTKPATKKKVVKAKPKEKKKKVGAGRKGKKKGRASVRLEKAGNRSGGSRR